jgi:hypothetical protein
MKKRRRKRLTVAEAQALRAELKAQAHRRKIRKNYTVRIDHLAKSADRMGYDRPVDRSAAEMFRKGK